MKTAIGASTSRASGRKMQPLVSILIPAYNAEKWIAETLRSALAQTWDNKEIIVVDDGSKDGTLQIARRFESDSVQVVTRGNQGATAARNFAFSLSKGDYIQWLDADDLLSPDKIERQMEETVSKRTLLSCAWGSFFHSTERAKFTPTSLWQDLTPVEWLLHKMNENTYMQTSTWLVSRELTEAAGPWHSEMYVDDDGEYFCRVLLASDGVRFVRGPKVYYRKTVQGVSLIGSSKRKIEAQRGSMNLHVKYLCSLERSARVDACCETYRRSVEEYIDFSNVNPARVALRMARWRVTILLDKMVDLAVCGKMWFRAFRG